MSLVLKSLRKFERVGWLGIIIGLVEFVFGYYEFVFVCVVLLFVVCWVDL